MRRCIRRHDPQRRPTQCRQEGRGGGGVPPPGERVRHGAERHAAHLAPGRADYVKAFEGLNMNMEKISGTLFEISGTLAKTLATLKSSGTPLGVSLKAQELFLKSVDPIL